MVALNNSTNLVSYKEAFLTIGVGESRVYENPYNFMRLLDSSGNDNALMFRFGASSIETFLTVGVGVRFPETLPNLTIRNLSNAPVTIRIAEIMGDIYDDRLTVTGQVSSIAAPYTVQNTAQLTLDSNGEAAIDSTNYKKVVIQNNSSSDSIFLFNNNTFEVLPMGSFDLNFAGQFTVYGTAGEKLSVAYFG